MLVWSENKVRVRVVQARRHKCHRCGQPFVYLADDLFEKVVRGMPYVSLFRGKSERQQKLLSLVRDEVSRRSLQGKGLATCPHCRQLVEWAGKTYEWAAGAMAALGRAGTAALNPFSKTDEEWARWLVEVQGELARLGMIVEPAEVWWVSENGRDDNEILVALPYADPLPASSVPGAEKTLVR